MGDVDSELRKRLVEMLDSEHAHKTFAEIVKDMPEEAINGRIEGIPYSPWQLVEHMRITQWDILEFVKDSKHVSPKWPEGYWPDNKTRATRAGWTKSIDSFSRDLEAAKKLAESAKDLAHRIPHGDGQTVLQEILTIADHNAYHLGELLVLRRMLGAWPLS